MSVAYERGAADVVATGGGGVVVVTATVVVVVVGGRVEVVGTGVANPHQYVPPHSPSPLKHCHGLRSAGSHGVHTPQPAEVYSKRSLLAHSRGWRHGTHAVLSADR
jgi:hypothetical protein